MDVRLEKSLEVRIAGDSDPGFLMYLDSVLHNIMLVSGSHTF